MTTSEPYDIVRVISGGRVTIPEGIRRLLKIKDGDHLAIYIEEETGAIKYVPVKIVPKKY